MNKRKKSFNEMMAEGDGYGALSAMNESEEPKTTSIDDFYLPHKIQAFNDAYMPKEEETQELYELIGRYDSTLPKWVLKGHTQAELANMPHGSVVRVGKKIGRNDPCPCGSGKKYKNCCIDKNY